MAVTLDGLEVELPKDWAPTLMAKAFESSVVGHLTTQKPMPLNGTVVPVYEGGFEAGYVPEGTAKPVSDVAISASSIVPKKFAGIVLVSKELARANPAQIMQHMQADMINGVARQVDYAVLYGKSAKTGVAVPETTSVNATTARVTSTDAIGTDLLAAYDAVAAGAFDPTGWAVDSRLRSKLAIASQAHLEGVPNLSLAVSNFAGLPAAYGRTVAGRVGTQTDTGVQSFAGDWDNGVYWGFSSNIAMERSREATVVDGSGNTRHLWQENLIGFLMEFEIGWYVNAEAFAAVDAAAAP